VTQRSPSARSHKIWNAPFKRCNKGRPPDGHARLGLSQPLSGRWHGSSVSAEAAQPQQAHPTGEEQKCSGERHRDHRGNMCDTYKIIIIGVRSAIVVKTKQEPVGGCCS
jgi:hypothetical protein